MTTELVKRVLIADDDDGIRRSLARILRGKGFDVATAADGETAVRLTDRFRPDLLLFDIRMPGIDGVEAYEQIRAVHPHVSAIFMTAHSPAVRVARAIEMGALSVLPKPLDLMSLSELVEHAFGRSERKNNRYPNVPPTL